MRISIQISVLLFVYFLTVAMTSGQSKYSIYPVSNYLDNSKQNFWDSFYEKYPQAVEILDAAGKSPPAAALLVEELQKMEKEIPHKTWPNVRAANKMPLPAPLVTKGGIAAFFNFDHFVGIYANDIEAQEKLLLYGIRWGSLARSYPGVAFHLMKNDAGRAEVSTIDIVRLTALIVDDNPGGAGLEEKVDRLDWQALHDSANPCYRFLALEYMNAIKPSPAELLQLYRECLFGSCSRLEFGAIMNMRMINDNRIEVAKLIEEYAKSKPVSNDGTLSSWGRPMGNAEEGAVILANIMREYIATFGESQPYSAYPEEVASGRWHPSASSYVVPAPTPKVDSQQPATRVTQDTNWLAWSLLAAFATEVT